MFVSVMCVCCYLLLACVFLFVSYLVCLVVFGVSCELPSLFVSCCIVVRGCVRCFVLVICVLCVRFFCDCCDVLRAVVVLLLCVCVLSFCCCVCAVVRVIVC